MDDIIVNGRNTLIVNQVISSLAARFSVKDVRTSNLLLGIEIIRNVYSVIMTQSTYTLDLLREDKMTDFKPAKTPVSTTEVLMVNNCGLLTDETKDRREAPIFIFHSSRHLFCSKQSITIYANSVRVSLERFQTATKVSPLDFLF